MRQIYRIYKLVKYIDMDIKKAEHDNPNVVDVKGYLTKPKIGPLIERYAKKNGVKFNSILQITESAEKNGYITITDDKECVSISYDKESFLIEGPRIFPYGLINARIKEFGNAFVMLLALVSLVVSIIAVLK